jgi:hypothetical protein
MTQLRVTELSLYTYTRDLLLRNAHLDMIRCDDWEIGPYYAWHLCDDQVKRPFVYTLHDVLLAAGQDPNAFELVRPRRITLACTQSHWVPADRISRCFAPPAQDGAVTVQPARPVQPQRTAPPAPGIPVISTTRADRPRWMVF